MARADLERSDGGELPLSREVLVTQVDVLEGRVASARARLAELDGPRRPLAQPASRAGAWLPLFVGVGLLAAIALLASVC